VTLLGFVRSAAADHLFSSVRRPWPSLMACMPGALLIPCLPSPSQRFHHTFSTRRRT
jgi:hypothetical protein